MRSAVVILGGFIRCPARRDPAEEREFRQLLEGFIHCFCADKAVDASVVAFFDALF